ncbi:hypothetical protein GCM10023258_13670 [Terrabacter aeriphilus]|uniref:Uncharacterized protein n=1 Tax=Terrabacter aeriphilus TaxID=515662 RepID=A0ABP9J780_9MICO
MGSACGRLDVEGLLAGGAAGVAVALTSSVGNTRGVSTTPGGTVVGTCHGRQEGDAAGAAGAAAASGDDPAYALCGVASAAGASAPSDTRTASAPEVVRARRAAGRGAWGRGVRVVEGFIAATD